MIDESTPLNGSSIQDLHGEHPQPMANEDPVGSGGAEACHVDVGVETPEELDAQANLVLDLLHELKQLTDRACDAALREAQHSAQVEERTLSEVQGLRLQLQEKDEALEVRDRAIRQRESAAAEKFQLLENSLNEKDAQLEHYQLRTKALLGEIDGLNLRLNEAAVAMQQAETRFSEFAGRQRETIDELRAEIKVKEQRLQEKDTALRQLDEQSCTAIRALERLLKNAHGDLESKETELRQKEAELRAAMARKEPLARLLKQVAAESQKLMAGLREKSQRMSELENKPRPSFDTALPWSDDAAIQARLL